MTNSLIPFGSDMGITITTTDGQEIALQPGGSLVDLLAPSGGGKPLPRLIAVQPRDSRGMPREWANQLALSQSETAINEDGSRERLTNFLGPFGERLVCRAVGYTLNRSLMPKYDPASGPEGMKPLCRSENFVTPDAAYAGKYGTNCCLVDASTGRLVPACPMARWGEKDAVTGKSQPPACQETYVIAIALEFAGESYVAEAYLKSASAVSGKTLVQQLRSLEAKGQPLYTFPVEFAVREAGPGNTYIARMLLPDMFRKNEAEFLPASEELPMLEDAVQRWQQAMKIRAERATRIPNTPETGFDQLARVEAQISRPSFSADAPPATPKGATTSPAAKKNPMI